MRGLLGLWLRWVAANTVGEVLGLGAVAAVAVLLFGGAEEPAGAGPVTLAAAVMILLGGFEGAVVGLAHGWSSIHRSSSCGSDPG